MEQKRHKRKNNHVFIFTTDAADASVRQFRVRSWVTGLLVIIACICFGATIGVLVFEGKLNAERLAQNASTMKVVEQVQKEKEQLELEKSELQTKIISLEDQIQLLSETVKQKTQNEQELNEQVEKMKIPTEFPLNSSATMEEVSEGDPMYIFHATSGAMVVATAEGTVKAINDDADFGKNIWIDHGNGFVTIYRNSGELKVKQGEFVTQGSTLFVVTDESGKLGYQIMKDGTYINPIEMLEISG